ncbi:VCBS repeat-containing protein [Mailhella sp.]|uniref:VCBS repeat-containing protein n=1 Tax=Mailhella sp. TaxID=1981029 RepID=UPI003AB85BAE
MSRRFLPALWAFTLLFLMMQVPAMAATYVVAPFSVSGAQGYSYLGQAVPSMLTSRLYLQGQFEPVGRQDAALKEKAPASQSEASSMARKFGADYVIWGSVTVMGDQASLDVSALSPDGKVWKEAATSPVNALIGGLQNVADSINIEVFGRTDVTRAAGSASGSPNSAFLMNETRGRVQNGTYLNPSLRYQGTEDARSQIRSQMIGFECLGMEVGDINGDGKTEILLLSENSLNAYVWENGNRLKEVGEYRIPSTMKPVLVRTFKQDGKNYVILTGYDKGDTGAYSQVLQFANGKFNVVVRNARRYLNVAKIPPLYAPTLIMQDSDRSKLVSGSVYEGRIKGDEVVRGGKLSNLPRQATLFNFSWIPADKGKRGDHLALIAENETLVTYDARGNRLAGTEDVYSGSSVYVEGDRGLGALTSSTDKSDTVLYYLPMRMPVLDLDRDGRYELIVNKPITAAGKLFSNYRTYPQGEIHALLWNGMGMELLWKTRRIKGTVCDVAVADVNNNGKLDLVVCVNSYPGLVSGVKTRCAVYLYPLDTTMVHAQPNYQE